MKPNLGTDLPVFGPATTISPRPTPPDAATGSLDTANRLSGLTVKVFPWPAGPAGSVNWSAKVNVGGVEYRRDFFWGADDLRSNFDELMRTLGEALRTEITRDIGACAVPVEHPREIAFPERSERMVRELNKLADSWLHATTDPHNIALPVSVALREVGNAIIRVGAGRGREVGQ